MVRSGDHVRGGQFAEEFRQGTVPFRPEIPGTAFSHDLALIRATKSKIQARVLRISKRRLTTAGADL